MPGKIIIFSGPGGVGKNTLIDQLKSVNPMFSELVSATTRDPRDGELDGEKYFFLSKQDFQQKVEQNEFVEHAETVPGRFYGTLKSEIQRIIDEHKIAIADINVDGAVKLKQMFPEDTLLVFVKAPSAEIMVERLRKRGNETEDSIKIRLDKAAYEYGFENQYDYVLINDVLQDALFEVSEVISDFLEQDLHVPKVQESVLVG